MKKGGEKMLTAKPRKARKEDISKLELYRLIGEGYKAMQDGRVSTIEEVKARIEKRRAERE